MPKLRKDQNAQNAMSFWQANEKPAPAGRSLKGELSVDVAIIGGGFTGLTTAREIKADDPAKSVAVLEAHYIGYGASGRNGGFNMTLFGLEPEITILRWGKDKAREAQEYMVRATSNVRDLVKKHKLKSDYQHTGMLRVAYSDAQLGRLEKSAEVFEKIGAADQFEFISGEKIREDINSPRFQGAMFEANSGILNPFKHVRELLRLAKEAGAEIFENSPVELVERNGTSIRLTTANGIVNCKKLVIAVNAWSGFIKGLPKIRSRQTPVWTSQVVTQPLSEKQWQEIGWQNSQSIEDNRQLIHYFRRTKCGRFTMGGGDACLGKGKAMGQMDVSKTWDNLENHVKWLFPTLKDIAFDYRWGGPVSINLDMAPEIGFIGDERIIYANGCIGHGVSLTQLNGRTIADLVLEKKTDLTDFWIVNRKAIRWPPSIFGNGAFHAIRGGLRLWDKIEERKLDKGNN